MATWTKIERFTEVCLAEATTEIFSAVRIENSRAVVCRRCL